MGRKKAPRSKEPKQAGRREPKEQQARKPLRLRYKILLACFGLLLVVGTELILRLFGFGSERLWLFLLRKGPEGKWVYRLNPRASERFFFRRYKGQPVAPSRVLPVEFPAEKSPDTIRIFAMGGSTTAGFPYQRSASFAGFLKAMLADLHPDKNFEVINCGLTAVNSYAVLDFIPEVLRCDPDLIVVYCGHNEFYGCHGVGSLEAISANRTAILLFMAIQKMRLYQAVKRLTELLAIPSKPKSATDLIRVMARDQEIRRHSRKHQIAESTFRKNIEAIIRRAARAGVPIMVATVASNVRDLSPLRSAHREGMSSAELDKWRRLWRKALAEQEAGNWKEAEALFLRTLRLDDEYAEAYFRLARCQAQMGRWDEARDNFIKALDYDVLRFRASPVFNEIIRQVVAEAQKRGTACMLADAADELARNAEGGVVGYDLMTDHLHPNTRGNYLIARTICKTLAESSMADRFGGGWNFDRLRTVAEYEKELGHTPIERLLTAQILYGLYSDFPFDKQIDRERRLAELRAEVERAAEALSDDERRAIAQWSGRYHTFSLHVRIGEAYLDKGNYARAAQSFRNALRLEGQGRREDRVVAWTRLAEAERNLGNFDRALDAYRKALELGSHRVEILYNIGRTYVAMRDWARAGETFEKILEIEPEHVDSLINLGLLWRDRRNLERAREYFRRAASIEAGRVVGNYHLARLELAHGQAKAAMAYLRKALEVDPEHVQSLRLLGFCHLQRREYAKAEKILARALAIDDSDSATWYNRACAAAATGRLDLAISSLRRAVQLGGENVRRRMATDRSFAPLRTDPRFRSLLGGSQ